MSDSVKPDGPNLGEMPHDVLEEIFSYLYYTQVSELGRECRSFREAARSILYRAISKIMTRIECEVAKIEDITKSQLESPSGNNSTIEQIHFAALMTVLKMCSSELRILQACCGRYMRDREFDFCFPAGDLLDDFDAVVKTVRCQTGEPDKRVGSDVTASLFVKTGRFLDFFDATLEMVVAREVPLGVTLLDILGCSQASDFLVELSHSEERCGHQLTGRYELRDTGTMDRPPELGDYSLAVQAKVLVRYLRNYVRWNNLFTSLDHLWNLEKKTADENNNKMADKSQVATHFFDELANKRIGHTRKRISDTDDICRDIFQASNSKLDSPLGLTIEFVLCSQDLPMSMEVLKGGHVKVKDSLVMSEKDSKDACIQTVLSYVDVTKESEDLMVEVDPDKVLDYVQSVKQHLTNVRDVVDQLAGPHSRPSTADFDSDRYFSSVESLRKMSPLSRSATPNSTLSFPYQCSAVSIDGNYNTPRQADYKASQYRHYNPSHVSVVYHCSLQSLPRDTQCDPHFILSSRDEGSVFSGSASDRGSKKSRSATRLLSSTKSSFVKQLIRPATVNGLVENCKLLEKLSERCVLLANSMDADENVEEDDEKNLSKGEELTREEEVELENVEVKEIREQVEEKQECKSSVRRQEVVQEFMGSEKFLMQMKIHYMSEEQEFREKVVKVNCTGSDVVIKCTNYENF